MANSDKSHIRPMKGGVPSQPTGICNWCEEQIPNYKRGMSCCSDLCKRLYESAHGHDKDLAHRFQRGKASKAQVTADRERKLRDE